jgi:uncharacterized membrane protein
MMSLVSNCLHLKITPSFLWNQMQKKIRFNWFTMFWDGFTGMSRLGRTLWLIVIVKLIVMFAILRPIFFPDFLKKQVEDESQKAEYVREQLIERSSIDSVE